MARRSYKACTFSSDHVASLSEDHSEQGLTILAPFVRRRTWGCGRPWIIGVACRSVGSVVAAEDTMSNVKTSLLLDRRHFLGGCISCLAGPQLLCKSAIAAPDAGVAAPVEHKFKADAQVSFEEHFKFAYAQVLIPYLNDIADEIGRKRLLKIVQTRWEEHCWKSGKKFAEDSAKPDFANFTQWARTPSRFWQHALGFSIVEDTPKAFEIKVTECIWAKVFRDAGAADIGYAGICNPDFATARGYSNKLRMVRPQTLMQGHDCCNHRWLWEG